ncbi:hypothetical protein MKZ38_007935 [Zalerion maritima]|uniref:Myb-like domain-containing protein n=1 Tax=Zalerion maritima TaxID=339359 RepID=A0AAD5RI30_9PEZI|nr:hypothetical protein MKZ38_007935 [Zalerion maritima]
MMTTKPILQFKQYDPSKKKNRKTAPPKASHRTETREQQMILATNKPRFQEEAPVPQSHGGDEDISYAFDVQDLNISFDEYPPVDERFGEVTAPSTNIAGDGDDTLEGECKLGPQSREASIPPVVKRSEHQDQDSAIVVEDQDSEGTRDTMELSMPPEHTSAISNIPDPAAPTIIPNQGEAGGVASRIALNQSRRGATIQSPRRSDLLSGTRIVSESPSAQRLHQAIPEATAEDQDLSSHRGPHRNKAGFDHSNIAADQGHGNAGQGAEANSEQTKRRREAGKSGRGDNSDDGDDDNIQGPAKRPKLPATKTSVSLHHRPESNTGRLRLLGTVAAPRASGPDAAHIARPRKTSTTKSSARDPRTRGYNATVGPPLFQRTHSFSALSLSRQTPRLRSEGSPLAAVEASSSTLQQVRSDAGSPSPSPKTPLPVQEQAQIPISHCTSCGLSADALLKVTTLAMRSTLSDESLLAALVESQNDKLSTGQSAALIMRSYLGIIHGHITSRLANRETSKQPSLKQDWSSYGSAVVSTTPSRRAVSATAASPKDDDKIRLEDGNSSDSGRFSDSDIAGQSESDVFESTESDGGCSDDNGGGENRKPRSQRGQWSALEERRLTVYMKEKKKSSWIADKLGRTESAVIQHWRQMKLVAGKAGRKGRGAGKRSSRMNKAQQ